MKCTVEFDLDCSSEREICSNLIEQKQDYGNLKFKMMTLEAYFSRPFNEFYRHRIEYVASDGTPFSEETLKELENLYNLCIEKIK